MKKCYMCDTDLIGSNSSKEHILPNAIGGRKTSNDLLCRKCNSNFGEGIDAEFAQQFLSLTSLLGVKKQRGDTVTLKNIKTQSGENYNLVDGRTPTLPHPLVQVVKDADGKTNLHIETRTEAEMKKKLQELSKKYGFDPIELFKKINSKQSHLTEPLIFDLKVGGGSTFRSITKTLLNFYLVEGGDRKYALPIVPYLKKEKELALINGYALTTPPYELGDSEVVHVLYIVGDTEHKTLYGYIELFSTFSYVVLLSNMYEGEAFTRTYCIDPLIGIEVEKVVTLNVPHELLRNQQNFDHFNPKIVEEKLNRLMRIIQERHFNKTLEEVTNNIFSSLPEDRMLTTEDIQIASEQLSMWFAEYLYYRMPKSSETEI